MTSRDIASSFASDIIKISMLLITSFSRSLNFALTEFIKLLLKLLIITVINSWYQEKMKITSK